MQRRLLTPLSYLTPPLVPLVLAGSLLAAQSATAAPVHITAQATVNAADGGTAQFVPLGTTLFADFRMNVAGSPAPGGAALSLTNVQGTFTWNDGAPRVFNMTGSDLLGYGAGGGMELLFVGSGPLINGFTAWDVGLTLNIGTNPFTSNENWDALLVGSTITSLVMMAGPSSYAARLEAGKDVSGSINAIRQTVPEPGSLALAALALAALCASGGTQQRKRLATGNASASV